MVSARRDAFSRRRAGIALACSLGGAWASVTPRRARAQGADAEALLRTQLAAQGRALVAVEVGSSGVRYAAAARPGAAGARR